ncbi:MAG: hypothetical protein H7096_02820 [Flavobacterium sp.]|nr:hypothetical protein [Pedobacter sp.]
MRKILILAALFVALGATTTSAQNNTSDKVISSLKLPGLYEDGRGVYEWKTVERRVWIPQRRTRGIFGIGSRTIPGHYEMRTERIKVYRNTKNARNVDQRKGWEGKHPHGMPPGQRKKLENNRDEDRNYSRYDKHDRDDKDDHDKKSNHGKGKKNKQHE